VDEMTRRSALERCHAKLLELLKKDKEPQAVACRAPGRINLIGGHTDYNEGFVFPITISKDMIIVAVPNSSKIVKIHSIDFNQTLSFKLDNFEKDGSWMDYAKGVAHFLQKEGFSPNGFTAACLSEIPIGGGLSSSAAFEVAVGHIFRQTGDLSLDSEKLAMIAYQAENVYMGISCGIMDQFISALGKRDKALFLDCRPPFKHELVPVPLKEHKIVIFNTKIRHAVKDFINIRKDECLRGVKLLQNHLPRIRSLRDASVNEFEEFKSTIPQPIRKRCEHVIRENARVLQTVNEMKRGNLKTVGELLYASHESLKTLYEVSCSELDFIIDHLKIEDGVVGGRLTGAGMGGCVFGLVINKYVKTIVDTLCSEYEHAFGQTLDVYICDIPNGVEKLKI